MKYKHQITFNMFFLIGFLTWLWFDNNIQNIKVFVPILVTLILLMNSLSIYGIKHSHN